MDSGFRIKEVWIFTCVDAEDIEGVIGMMTPGGWMPFVCADKERVDCLIPHAKEIAKASGLKVKLSKFSIREDLEEM